MLKSQEVVVDIAQLLQLFKPRNWMELTMEVKEDESEFAEVDETPLSIDLNTVTGFWRDQDGGTCVDTETDSYKVSNSYDEIKAAINK